MSDTAIFVESLRDRIRAMNVLWERAISDMTLGDAALVCGHRGAERGRALRQEIASTRG
jgi:hypothetical protein